MNATLVVLSKYPEIFEGFRESVEHDAPDIPKLVVWDGNGTFPPGWDAMSTPGPFQIARNANLGWKWAKGDVVYSGDDVRLIEPNTIQRLYDVAYSDPDIGIIGTKVTTPTPVQPFVPFVFVYIKRAVIDAIGYLDERFTGYGCEDVDFCYRAAKAGFKVGMSGITVQHGVEGHAMMSTFRRVKTMEQIAAEDSENWDRFADKYSLPHDRVKIWKWMEECDTVRSGRP